LIKRSVFKSYLYDVHKLIVMLSGVEA